MSHVNTYECNCVTDDLCEDMGSVTCNTVVSGTESGYDVNFDAVCVRDDGSPPFQTTVPRTTGNVCVYGGNVLGNQCVQLW